MIAGLDAERAILGIYMQRPDLLGVAHLEARHFVRQSHRDLFRFLRSAEWTGPEEIALRIEEQPQVAKNCGGIGYVMGHAELAPSTENPEHYEHIVLDRWQRAEIARAAVAAQTMALDGEEPADIAASTRAALDGIESVGKSDVVGPEDGAASVLAQIAEEAAGRRQTYLYTGWTAWDDEWVGLPSEGVILFLARSGMGKTSLINSLAVAMASRGTTVFVHGTEVSAEKRNSAILYGMAGVSPRQWGFLTRQAADGVATGDQEWALKRAQQKLYEAAEQRATLPLHVSGTTREPMTVERLAGEIRRQRARGCGVAFVDYIQDFPPSEGMKSDRMVQVVHASRVLKDLTAELRIPIILAAQVSGEKDGIPKKGHVVPQMWDAQWASGLHQDAEEVYAINRGDYWQQRMLDVHGAETTHDAQRFGVVGQIDIHARKRREAALGHIALPWDGTRRWVGPAWSLDDRRLRAG